MAVLLVLVVLVLPAATVVYLAQRPGGPTGGSSAGGEAAPALGPGNLQLACASDAKVVATAVEAIKAETGTYPSTLAELVGRAIRSTPNTAHYTIALGSNPAPGATGPQGPAGAPADWPVGSVLVAPGPPPVDSASYRRVDGPNESPCHDPAIR